MRTAQTNPLNAWRTALVREVSDTPQFQSLTSRQRRITRNIIQANMSPTEGAFPSQENLGKRFGLGRQAMNKELQAITGAGVFVVERRGRTSGDGGRTTNAYRVHSSLSVLATWTSVIGRWFNPTHVVALATKYADVERELLDHVEHLRQQVALAPSGDISPGVVGDTSSETSGDISCDSGSSSYRTTCSKSANADRPKPANAGRSKCVTRSCDSTDGSAELRSREALRTQTGSSLRSSPEEMSRRVTNGATDDGPRPGESASAWLERAGREQREASLRAQAQLCINCGEAAARVMSSGVGLCAQHLAERQRAAADARDREREEYNRRLEADAEFFDGEDYD